MSAENSGQIKSKLILASGSPRRVQLLEQIGITPHLIKPVDLDETPEPREIPRKLAQRLARQKAQKCVQMLANDANINLNHTEFTYNILASDTVVGVGRRILGKAQSIEQARDHLALLSGRAHRVFTSVAIIDGISNKLRQKTVETRVRFKRLSTQEINNYLASGEWRDKAGSYAIQGFAGTFVINMIGQYSNVVGLPLYETTSLLRSVGIDPAHNWPDQTN
ncbi:MAG: septum formation protein Maf [Hyphomicrobiales bacterium]|nr:MAG: septum formation protein Maf [Hyphomicrobiales bacterium]